MQSLYGPIILLAHLTGGAVLVYRARSQGVSWTNAFDLVFFAATAGALGARVGYWLSHPGEIQNLDDFFSLQRGGLSLFPALLSALFAYLILCSLKKWCPWSTADLLSPALFLGLAVVRLGCLQAGCCYGQLEALHFHSSATPSQIFPLPVLEIVVLLGISSFVWKRTPLLDRSGLRTLCGFALYGIWRLVTDPMRLERDPFWPGVIGTSSGILYSSALLVISGSVALYLFRRPRPSS